MTPLVAFTKLHEDWPMTPEYREKAWKVLESAILVKETKNKRSDLNELLIVEKISGIINGSCDDAIKVNMCKDVLSHLRSK